MCVSLCLYLPRYKHVLKSHHSRQTDGGRVAEHPGIYTLNMKQDFCSCKRLGRSRGCVSWHIIGHCTETGQSSAHGKSKRSTCMEHQKVMNHPSPIMFRRCDYLLVSLLHFLLIVVSQHLTSLHHKIWNIWNSGSRLRRREKRPLQTRLHSVLEGFHFQLPACTISELLENLAPFGHPTLTCNAVGRGREPSGVPSVICR